MKNRTGFRLAACANTPWMFPAVAPIQRLSNVGAETYSKNESKFARGRSRQEGFAGSARTVQQNAISYHAVAFKFRRVQCACTTERICSFAASIPPTSAKRSAGTVRSTSCCCTLGRATCPAGTGVVRGFCLGRDRKIQKDEIIQARWGSVLKSEPINQLKQTSALPSSVRDPKEEDRKSKRNAAGHHELQGLLQDGWQTPQRSSQKTDQHHCRKPQHWRIEKPFLRRVRHSITKLAGYEGWKRFQPVPVPSSHC